MAAKINIDNYAERDPNLLFSCNIQVDAHLSKKNSRPIFRNKATGKTFLGKKPGLAQMERHIINQFVIAFHDSGLKAPIAEFFQMKCTFMFDKKNFYTKKWAINKKIPDISNLYQLPEDCLTKAGVIKDDHYVHNHDGSRRVESDCGNYLVIELYKI